jgi:signal transduction histidine kinase
MSLTDIIIPITFAFFVISFGVVLLYQNFQKNLVKLELEKTAIEAKQQNELLQNSIIVEEQERKRIARDLHDDLGAIISIVNMNLKLMRQKQSPAELDSDYTARIDNLINLSTKAIDSIRSISHQLMPAQLELFGLIKTVESVIKHLNQSEELTAELIIKCEWPVIKWEVALGAYRIIMELINNSIKHANANYMLFIFECEDKNLVIHFEDNGIGFPDSNKTITGLGLTNMAARAKVMNSHFECRNGSEAGVKATVTIPNDFAIITQNEGNA